MGVVILLLFVSIITTIATGTDGKVPTSTNASQESNVPQIESLNIAVPSAKRIRRDDMSDMISDVCNLQFSDCC